MTSTSRGMLSGIVLALVCAAIGAGTAWFVRGLAIERDAAVAQAAAQRTVDSLRVTIATQWAAVEKAQVRADRAESLFVADSAKHLSAARGLLARIASLQATSPAAAPSSPAAADPVNGPGPTLGEVSTAIRGCLLSASQCGEARAAAEQVADSLRGVARTQQAQHRADSIQRVEDARAHAIALSRASGRNAWRDVKVAGWTGLALTAGCAVSHFGNPFGGK